jgi:hypothetical protein
VAVGDARVDDASAFGQAMKDQELRRGIRLQIMRDHVRRFVFVKIG